MTVARRVGVCYLPDGTNVGAEIIRRGLALDCPALVIRPLPLARSSRNPGRPPPGTLLPRLTDGDLSASRRGEWNKLAADWRARAGRAGAKQAG